jgi:hypothetical protein
VGLWVGGEVVGGSRTIVFSVNGIHPASGFAQSESTTGGGGGGTCSPGPLPLLAIAGQTRRGASPSAVASPAQTWGWGSPGLVVVATGGSPVQPLSSILSRPRTLQKIQTIKLTTTIISSGIHFSVLMDIC